MSKFILAASVAGIFLSSLSTAEACSIGYQNYSDRPVMADLVRSANSIELAEVVSASPLTFYESLHSTGPVRTHMYSMLVVEQLKGSATNTFEFRASTPLRTTPPSNCPDMTEYDGSFEQEECLRYYSEQFSRQNELETAQENHTKSSFWNDISSYDFPGEGGLFSDCSLQMGLEIGGTYLVFRDENEAPIWASLNFERIQNENDEWLNAVRYFLENPSRDRLPAKSVQSWVSEAGQAAIFERDEEGYCLLYHRTHSLRGSNRHNSSQNHPWDDLSIEEACEMADQLLITDHAGDSQYEIRDGLVDFSNIKSQFEITGELQVPLETVISWFEDDAAQ